MKQLFVHVRTSLSYLGFALALAAFSAHQASAQAAQAANTAPAISSDGSATPGADDPKLKLSPTKVLEAFEPSADAEYELGPGDEISLDVPGHAELTGKHTVGPDGRITLPVAGTVELANKSRLGASQAIKDALTPYYTDVSVTLSIDKYGSNHVTILGNVKNPGVLYFDSTPTLLETISRGGLSANTTSKDGIPDRCIIYRGNDQSVTVELRSLLQNGNGLADMRLRRNDIVFVPPQKNDYVSVMGEVKNPGAVALTPDLSLHLAIAQAGGFTDSASKNITLVSGVTGKTTTITYKQMMMPNGDKEITLHPGDIIAIPKTGFSKATTVITKLSPIATMLTIGALLQ
ncbi:polysaccharide export outer membrane protein [Silvibacterium bohemicum]|uniref:Polysaccharide export outer membrane protein n=1 Tax=Silvibacterium bohemicum TaxID=1577686 RepID=A0A841JUX8_9BACT|nr:polysaccharide biosynthesis/export family protein [Silvibacterium bohemicum]MBB6142801.1 polysaccharide export outer membrane protein [Silvibacterium bohemicum]